MADKENKLASPAQVAAITKIATRCYGGTASTLIGLGSNFAFLNAVGAGNEEKAKTLLVEWMQKDQAERKAYKDAHPVPA